MANKIGSTWFDELNDAYAVTRTQGRQERWDECVDTHKSDVLDEQSVNEPAEVSENPPPGVIPTPSATLKVTPWWGADKSWHWVSTERNPGESDAAWDARHEAYVTASKVDFPEP